MNPTFCFITDFSHDFAVACMEALILKSLPNARIIHLDHSIEKFCLVSAAFVLNASYTYFPDNTIFIAIIDPGVGSERQTLCIETERYSFIGPNNGIFHYILENNQAAHIWHINEQVITPASYTFHGRDLFTPAAISLAQSNRDFLIPAQKEKILYLSQLQQQIITYIDSFGNIKTNIPAKQFKSSLIMVTIGNVTHIIKFARTFSEVSEGDLVAYCGSNNTLEIAVNLGSAAKKLQARAGQLIKVNSCI